MPSKRILMIDDDYPYDVYIDHKIAWQNPRSHFMEAIVKHRYFEITDQDVDFVESLIKSLNFSEAISKTAEEEEVLKDLSHF